MAKPLINRTVYVKLQTIGKTVGYTIVTGGWHYN